LRPGGVALTLAKATPPVGLLIPEKQALTNKIGLSANDHSRNRALLGAVPIQFVRAISDRSARAHRQACTSRKGVIPCYFIVPSRSLQHLIGYLVRE
jgi:hypothetical protein